VTVPHKGHAAGLQQWFRYESGITEVMPKHGSRYGGQKITITGFGFAPYGVALASDGDREAADYAVAFQDWSNFGTGNESTSFNFDVEAAGFDSIVATTHFRGERRLEGDFHADWAQALSVDVARLKVGYVAPNSYKTVRASPGGTNNYIVHVFDHNPLTVFGGSPTGLELEIVYTARAAFLLTDYQLQWDLVTSECPSKWRVFGREGASAASPWVLVDTVSGPLTEPATWKFVNRTVDNPGIFLEYKWAFAEWAPANGSSVLPSTGYWIRDINLNPNGCAWHYGIAMPKAPVAYEFGLGLKNVAFGKPVNQVRRT
jgi:hypothetical protein